MRITPLDVHSNSSPVPIKIPSMRLGLHSDSSSVLIKIPSMHLGVYSNSSPVPLKIPSMHLGVRSDRSSVPIKIPSIVHCTEGASQTSRDISLFTRSSSNHSKPVSKTNLTHDRFFQVYSIPQQMKTPPFDHDPENVTRRASCLSWDRPPSAALCSEPCVWRWWLRHCSPSIRGRRLAQPWKTKMHIVGNLLIAPHQI